MNPGIIADWDDFKGTDNTKVIQAALDGGEKVITFPPGRSLVLGNLRPKTACVIEAAWCRQSELIHRGTGIAIQFMGTSDKELLDGACVRNLGLNAGPETTGMVSMVDTYCAEVSGCSFENGPRAFATELQNRRLWTEGARLIYNQVRSTGVHYKFSRTGGTDSFADTKIISADVLTMPGERMVQCDPGSNIYAPWMRFKANVSVPRGATPNVNPAMLFDLKDGSNLSEGEFSVYSEMQHDPGDAEKLGRPFLGFNLGANCYVAGRGTARISPSPEMSREKGAKCPVNQVHSTACLYQGPNGEFLEGTSGPSRMGVNESIMAQCPLGSSGATRTLDFAFQAGGLCEYALTYNGAERGANQLITVSRNPWALYGGTTVTIGPGHYFKQYPIFGSVEPVFDTYGNAVLRVGCRNLVAGGTLTIVATLRTHVNEGTELPHGKMKPIVLLP